MEYIESKNFDKLIFTEDPLPKAEYEKCVFKSCDFSNSDLSDIKFLSCIFSSCNISLVKLSHVLLQDAVFRDCKMMGLNFRDCNTFGFTVSFDGCNLNHSSFYELKMKKTVFKNTQLHGVDFTSTDLNHSVFDNCDLTDAKFENTLIENTDFTTAINYTIDPVINHLKKARFSLTGVEGLLRKFDIKIEG